MVSQEAQRANAWASLEGCAGDLERVLKLSRKLVDDKSLASLEKATQDYLTRYRNFLEMKESSK